MTTTDTRTADELAEAIRNGDISITADDLRAARDREQLAQLHDEAGERAARQLAEQEHAAAVAQLVADVERLSAPTFAELDAQLAELGAEYSRRTREHNRQVAELGHRAQLLGLSEGSVTRGELVGLTGFGGGLRTASGAAAHSVDGPRHAADLLATALRAEQDEAAAAARAAREADAPTREFRRFRSTANGQVVEHPADRVPSFVEGALKRRPGAAAPELVELDRVQRVQL